MRQLSSRPQRPDMGRGGRVGFPAPRRHPARPRFRPARPAARSLRRHVFWGERERPAAPGGAAQAGGRRGEDQGLSGGRRASAVLHAECLQGCPAAWRSSWKQPLPGAQILCFTVKTGKEEVCWGSPWRWMTAPYPKKSVFNSQISFSLAWS